MPTIAIILSGSVFLYETIKLIQLVVPILIEKQSKNHRSKSYKEIALDIVNQEPLEVIDELNRRRKSGTITHREFLLESRNLATVYHISLTDLLNICGIAPEPKS